MHTKHPRPEVPTIDHRLLAGKLGVYDWLDDLPRTGIVSEIVEVRFKNTRKGFYTNPSRLVLKKGDIVAVEAALGHDIGVVSLTGELVKEQLRLKRVDPERTPLKKVYRKAKPHDIEKWQQAIALEHETMIRSRKIAADLHLNMKIGDVEYQGDKTKAIFYYIADDRVDFRTLIKVLAETFHIRIEMKQIGSRQEAGRIGGIGPCGRKLCCSTFITNFVSVSTSAARYQDISLNPQKLAGQCAKLKCCLNYEVDAYVECLKRLPSKEITLETADATYFYFKADILKGTITYSTDKSLLANEVTITARRAFEVINMNKRGEKPVKLLEDRYSVEPARSKDLLEQESLTRFDKNRNGKNRKKKNKSSSVGGGNVSPVKQDNPQKAKQQSDNNPPKEKSRQQRQSPQQPVAMAENEAVHPNRNSRNGRRNGGNRRPRSNGGNKNPGGEAKSVPDVQA